MNDKPKKQFRGWTIPADVVRLFEDGKINANETLLMAMVDGLVSPDKGCYAGNEYLSEHLHVSSDLVSHMITKLKRMGLIVAIGFDGRVRYLETAWSRINDKKAIKFLKSKGAEARQTGAKKRSKLGIEPESDTGKIPSPTYINNTTTKRSSIDKKKHSLSRPTVGDGDCGKPSEKSRKKQPSKFDHRCVKELAAAVSTVIKVNKLADMRKWADQFRLMRTYDKVPAKEIKAAIQWYAKHIGGEYVPEAFSAKAFREKYPKMLAAMRRSAKRDDRDAEMDDEQRYSEFQGRYLRQHPEHCDMLESSWDKPLVAKLKRELGIKR